MKRYQFLLFDADGTLLDFETACAHAFQRTYFAQGLDLQKPYSAQLLESYRKNNENWWGKLERGECTRPQLYLGRFADFLQENGLSGDPQALHETYFPLLGEGGDLLPGAEELVKRLKAAGYFLYLITNGKASTQRTRLERSGLQPYFEDCFISEDTGFAKPDFRFFDYVFSRIPGFSAKRGLVIGDSLSSDIQGAANAGLDSIWYAPSAAENKNKAPYTLLARSYEEILRFLCDE